MKWTPGGESQDVEDRRDESGGGGGFQFGGMHIGIGGAILLLILSFVFKTNFFALLSGGGSVSPGPAAVRKPDPARDAAEKPLVQFVSFVLDDTQKTWTELLPQQGGEAVSPREAGALPGFHSIGMRRSGSRDGPILLSRRRKGLHRSGVL